MGRPVHFLSYSGKAGPFRLSSYSGKAGPFFLSSYSGRPVHFFSFELHGSFKSVCPKAQK